MLIFGRRHLEAVVRRYVTHYNTERPHGGLGPSPPCPKPAAAVEGPTVVRRNDVLGGLVHEYHLAAA
jgi:transposase InsO family protein